MSIKTRYDFFSGNVIGGRYIYRVFCVCQDKGVASFFFCSHVNTRLSVAVSNLNVLWVFMKYSFSNRPAAKIDDPHTHTHLFKA